MRSTYLVFALCSLASSTASADTLIHVVRAGDSLGALAVRYGVEVDDLRAWNELEGDTIQIGQELAVSSDAMVRYRTVPGDTLSCIAERYGVPAARIREDNRALARRGLEVGMVLRIVGARAPERGSTAQVHRVAQGELLARIARRYGVSARDIAAWNPGLAPDRLRVGQPLTIRGAGSESVGSAWCGFIRGAVQLGAHPAYVLRNRSRAWGTARTIELLRAGFDAHRRAHPNAARVRVHDLSLEGGGPIDDHRSHQSGRDVDITYYRRGGCGPDGCPLETVTARELDVRRQWTLLHHWLRRGVIEAIYVDYALTEVLYREAERRGASRAELEAWFQYPRGRHAEPGLVRHFPNHANHLHVRFACAPGDTDCR